MYNKVSINRFLEQFSLAGCNLSTTTQLVKN